MDYDFTGLTTAQQWLLSTQGFAFDPTSARRGPRRTTVAPLIERGLVIERANGHWPSSFEVPLAVHIAWCAHCAGLEC